MSAPAPHPAPTPDTLAPAAPHSRSLRTLWAILRQSAQTVTRRPVRSLLTAIGVALGVAVLIASVGMAATLNAQVNATFDELRATRIVVIDNRNIIADPLFDLNTVDQRLGGIPGVVAAGYMSGDHNGVSADVAPSVAVPATQRPVVQATPGALAASKAKLAAGRFYDATSATLNQPMAVLGPQAAKDLGITTLSPGLAILIHRQPVPVVGILATYGSEPQLMDAVIIDPRVMADLGLLTSNIYTALVRTESGAAVAVATTIPLTLRPSNPKPVGLIFPPEPEALREGVQGSLNTLTLGVAGLAVLLGGIGIMNSMIVAVSQRIGEIGLRRAIGARPWHIGLQVLAEGALIGLLGAVIGTIFGVLALIVICQVNHWQAVLPVWAWFAPAAGGLLVGALAGLYPAARATRMSPAAALRAQ